MAKIILNLPTAFNWWSNIVDNEDIPPLQQLAMFHIINRLNKNFWSPAQISISKLAASMNSDRRTVKTAVDALIARNFVVSSKEGICINVGGKSCQNVNDTADCESGLVGNNSIDRSTLPDNVRSIFG